MMTRAKAKDKQERKGVAPAAPVTDSEFSACLSRISFDLCAVKDIAVAVSGGADSLALLYLLGRWAAIHAPSLRIHALTVDHGLRPESKSEAQQVATWIAAWGQNKRHQIPAHLIRHQILMWRGVKPKTKIIETARQKRYALMEAYCKKNKIPCLFLAHHRDDQAETVLMRLAAGSGVDGLAGMAPVSFDHGVLLLRPLLDMPHDRLCASLRTARQDWVEDPTNQNDHYARSRLRHARDVLAREGLTPVRLAALARRASAAREVCVYLAEKVWADHVQVTSESVQIGVDVWQGILPDTRTRLLVQALGHIAGAHRPPRLEQVEAMISAFDGVKGKTLRRTLGGCMVSYGTKWIKISRETKEIRS